MKRHLTQTEKSEYSYIVQAISSVINSTEPPIPYDGINWKSLLARAKDCSVETMLCEAVLKLPKQYLPNEKVLNFLKEKINQGIVIDTNLSYEIERVIRAFEKNKVKNLPLKGYFMKHEYPRTDYRSVSDFDILFDETQFEQMKSALLSLGFEYLRSDEEQCHFQKRPYMYIEMHKRLIDSSEPCYEHLKSQLDRASLRSNFEYSYNMSLEDYYIYMVIHCAHHFRDVGMGLRMLLDIYVFLKNHSKSLNRKYIDEILSRYNLGKFENKISSLSFLWFGKKTVISFDDFETYIFLNGTLGTIEHGILVGSQKLISEAEKQGKKKSKLSFLVYSVFPPLSAMRKQKSYLKKMPFLLPFAWLSVWARRIFIDRNVSIKRGYKNRMSYTDEDVCFIKNVLNQAGFDDF